MRDDLLGAHVSTSGGVEKAPERGFEIGCNAIQIFSKNKRMLKSKPYIEGTDRKFRENCKKYRIKKVIIHTSYLLNLATIDPIKREKTISGLIDEFERGDYLDIPYLVIHPGSAIDTTEERGLFEIAKNVNTILKKKRYKIRLLFETTAGQGNNLGYKFEHLSYLLKNIKNDNIGICLDTCHTFVSGYDIRTKKTYERTIFAFDEIVGLKNLFAIHLNDSRAKLGSRIDRHENIGEGYIGKEAFSFIVNDERLKNIPMILETPNGDEWYKKSLRLLRGMKNG
jgi:deoxyribonuclease-4